MSSFTNNYFTSFTATESAAFEVYSPGMRSPEPLKKPRKNISAPSVSAAGAALQAASRAKVSAKASRRVVDSDEDESGEEGEVEVIQRTPKPVRQRAIKSYVQDSEEEDESGSDYRSD